MTEQLYFSDLILTPDEDFDNFVPGVNEELYSSLSSLAPAQAVLIWGLPGSGKTHLLKATAKNNKLYYLTFIIAGKAIKPQSKYLI